MSKRVDFARFIFSRFLFAELESYPQYFSFSKYFFLFFIIYSCFRHLAALVYQRFQSLKEERFTVKGGEIYGLKEERFTVKGGEIYG